MQKSHLKPVQTPLISIQIGPDWFRFRASDMATQPPSPLRLEVVPIRPSWTSSSRTDRDSFDVLSPYCEFISGYVPKTIWLTVHYRFPTDSFFSPGTGLLRSCSRRRSCGRLVGLHHADFDAPSSCQLEPKLGLEVFNQSPNFLLARNWIWV